MACNAMEGSTYNSFVPKYKALWTIMKPLAQLHHDRKFWLQGEPENKLLNTIHNDEDAEEGEDDEIGPGCYVLDIGISYDARRSGFARSTCGCTNVAMNF